PVQSPAAVPVAPESERSVEKARGASRLALLLAGICLVAGLVVVVAAYSRAPSRPAPPSEGSAAPSDAVDRDQGDPVEAQPEPSTLELPDDPQAPQPRPTGHPRPRVRVSRPIAPTAPKTSGPHITSQPRY